MIPQGRGEFADAPQYGVPVVLNSYASGSHQSVVETGFEPIFGTSRRVLAHSSSLQLRFAAPAALLQIDSFTALPM